MLSLLLKLMFDLPDFPFLVEMRTTPLAALAPYIAVEAASFRTSIDSMSSEFKAKKLPGTPSIRIRGDPFPPHCVPPLRTRTGVAPGCPVDCVTCKPAIVP